MRVIQVGVKAENLPKARFAVSKERFRKTGFFPNPTLTGKGCQWSTKRRRAHRDRSGGAWGDGASRCKTCRASSRIICWKGFLIVNLTNYPSLNEGDILACWNSDRNFIVVEPRVCVAAMLN
jgi:hypothetical protein